MHKFKNQKIQDLYDYLGSDFNENDFTYSEADTLKTFGVFVDELTKEDWLYLEDSINLWDSKILERFARVNIEYDYKNMDYCLLQNKIYCLAFINCQDEESNQLCTNLAAELGVYVDVDAEILNRVIERLEELLNSPVVHRSHGVWHTERTMDVIKEKLELTLAKKN